MCLNVVIRMHTLLGRERRMVGCRQGFRRCRNLEPGSRSQGVVHPPTTRWSSIKLGLTGSNRRRSYALTASEMNTSSPDTNSKDTITSTTSTRTRTRTSTSTNTITFTTITTTTTTTTTTASLTTRPRKRRRRSYLAISVAL